MARAQTILRALAAAFVVLAMSAPADAGAMRLKFLHKGSAADPICASAAISSPVVGTSLADVCALKDGGTGPRFASTNGTWVNAATSLGAGAYLTNLGCALSNSGSILCTVAGGGSITIEKYNFAGAPPLAFYGDNITIRVRDCYFTTYGIGANFDANSNAQNAQHVVLYNEHNQFDSPGPKGRGGQVALVATGELHDSFNRYKNQWQVIWYTDNSAPRELHLNIHDNYITGGGVNYGEAHMEMIQFLLAGEFLFYRNFVNLVDGQARGAANIGGWTSVLVSTAPKTTLWDNIFANLRAVNAAHKFPSGTINGILSTKDATFANNAMEPGLFGYSQGAEARNGGGNRHLRTNEPIKKFCGNC